MSYIRWLETKPSCVACQTINYRKGIAPPCSECIVDVADEDHDVACVYLACRNHWITNGERVIDIDIKAIESAMRIYQVKQSERKTCYERVRKLFHLKLKDE